MSKSSLSLVGVFVLVWFPASQRTAIAGQSGASAGVWTELVQPERGLIEWCFQGRKLLAYTFATNQFKPYVRELSSLAGDHALTDSTPFAFLIERRTLTLIVDEAKEDVALTWHAEFEVGARTNRVTLRGSEYNGLGLRLPAAWDHVARHENSENTPYPAGGKPGAVPARWGAVSHIVDGRTMYVALFARPRGQAGTNSFFAMTEPFTYLAATQGLDRAPLEYRAGDRFAIDYLVLVNPAARTAAQIEARYLAWARELDDKETTT